MEIILSEKAEEHIMERKLMSELLKWKDKSSRKPLLLEGARQVGKTYLFYWTGGESSEVDFVMQYGAEIVPIEVKSGTNVNAKSLKIFRETYSPRISIRFSLKNTRLDNDLQNISLFSIFLCEQLLKTSSEKCVKSLKPSSRLEHEN